MTLQANMVDRYIDLQVPSEKDEWRFEKGTETWNNHVRYLIYDNRNFYMGEFYSKELAREYCTFKNAKVGLYWKNCL
jgi:hypothetical protein